MAKVNVKSAHRELRKLARRLARFNEDTLNMLLPPEPKKPGMSSRGLEWASGIERTALDLEGWCRRNSPNQIFSMEIPPRAAKASRKGLRKSSRS